jgi:hypothetical protein
MDTEQFRAPPMTTGALLAHYRAYGRTAARTDVELVHFLEAEQIRDWLDDAWKRSVRPLAERAVAEGLRPVFGFSCYTWNVAEFLELACLVKTAVPEALIVAGGPHVQRPEDFLFDDAIDLVVLGEGEETFTELLDRRDEAWAEVAGCAYLDAGVLRRSQPRGRLRELDGLPSALDVLALRDDEGRPLYSQVSYETSRGCPYKCAFCEWGTGAIGTKMYQFSLERVRSDFEKLVAGGIRDIWLADSNFGALREDEAKTEIVVELRRRTGLPNTLATSWSKYHSERVQRIVRLLHRSGLLSHYHLALQTLTPKALELSNRTNMRANDYEPIVKAMAAEGVPVAAELIWGLPGDTLADFERNLDHLLTVFPNINIFGYTLLPGTEFFERREQYRLETIPVAGYGKAKGEYVVGCSSFDRAEGEEGYFLGTAYILLARGQLMPFTTRLLALSRRVPVAAMLRTLLRDLLEGLGDAGLPALAGDGGRMEVYEQRSRVYLALMADLERTYSVLRASLDRWLQLHCAADLSALAAKTLTLDRALCPRVGPARIESLSFDFAIDAVAEALAAMTMPDAESFAAAPPRTLEVRHPGGVGEVCMDPDGGEWVRGRFARSLGSGDASAPERVAG